MKKFMQKLFICYIFIFAPFTYADSANDKTASFHVGVLHPNGVDVIGYSVESEIYKHIYWFYDFGFPSLAAIGINYYQNYQGSGMTATLGVGIGSVTYTSLAFQWKIGSKDYLKLGAGLTASVAYSGTFPVLSYEHRF